MGSTNSKINVCESSSVCENDNDLPSHTKVSFFRQDFSPGTFDVIIGRGNKCNDHLGNKRLNHIVMARSDEYFKAADQDEMSNIITSIVNFIRSINAHANAGGFVKLDSRTNRWFDVGDYLARETISKAFRTALKERQQYPNEVRSSTAFLPNTVKSSLLNINKVSQKLERNTNTNIEFSAPKINVPTDTNVCFFPNNFSPGVTDVIFGEINKCHKHIGNKRLNLIINSCLDEYSKAVLPIERAKILQSIIRLIRSNLAHSKGGSFVEFDPKRNRWFDVGDRTARDNISKAFRAALNKRQKHSNKTIANTAPMADSVGPSQRLQINNLLQILERNHNTGFLRHCTVISDHSESSEETCDEPTFEINPSYRSDPPGPKRIPMTKDVKTDPLSGTQISIFPKNFTPRTTDVIIGRGKKCHEHLGNKTLKHIVTSRLDEYSKAVLPNGKTKIIRSVVGLIRSNNDHAKAGGFVKLDPKTNQWFDVGDRLASEKISKAFRDTLIKLQKCLNKTQDIAASASDPIEPSLLQINNLKFEINTSYPSDSIVEELQGLHPSRIKTLKKNESTNIDSLANTNSIPSGARICYFPIGFTPGITDVIIGTGKRYYDHLGNKILKDIVVSRLDEYSVSVGQLKKSEVLNSIIGLIRNYDHGNVGGFFKLDTKTNRWFDVGDRVARDFISRAFRSATKSRYRNSRF